MPSIQDLFNLTGRTAIVTGGSRGLGEEMAEGLAEAGASLMLCARRDEWLTPTVHRLSALGHRVEGRVADVAKPADVQAVVDAACEAFGQVDILVNNAGVTWGERPEAMPLDKWQKVLDINLTGAFLFAQAAGREMLKRQARAHHQRRVDRRTAFVGARTALCGIRRDQGRSDGPTRELAASGREGIRVNAIAGIFHSRLADPAIPLAEPSIKASCPIPRVGAAGELKGVAVFLASTRPTTLPGRSSSSMAAGPLPDTED